MVQLIARLVAFAHWLYDYYQIHKNNKRLLDVMRGFTSNLDTVRQRVGKVELALNSCSHSRDCKPESTSSRASRAHR
jgi:hypothetical protein